MEYSEKVGLITGGAEGIGRGIAERLLMNGIKGVCIIDVNKDLGEETTQYFKTQFGHGRTLFIHCDVTSKTSLRDAFKKTKECYDRIDIVCNNAGIVNELEWQTMMHVNLFAVIEGTYLGLEFMGTQHGGFGGTVINVSSSNGLKPNKFLPTYAASKHGVIGFSRSVAEEPNVVDNNIRVVAVCPIMVMTSLERSVAFTGTRYTEQMIKTKAEKKDRPEASITDVVNVVIKCLEDDSTNGKVYLTLPGGDMTDIGFPDVNDILRNKVLQKIKQ